MKCKKIIAALFSVFMAFGIFSSHCKANWLSPEELREIISMGLTMKFKKIPAPEHEEKFKDITPEDHWKIFIERWHDQDLVKFTRTLAVCTQYKLLKRCNFAEAFKCASDEACKVTSAHPSYYVHDAIQLLKTYWKHGDKITYEDYKHLSYF